LICGCGFFSRELLESNFTFAHLNAMEPELKEKVDARIVEVKSLIVDWAYLER